MLIPIGLPILIIGSFEQLNLAAFMPRAVKVFQDIRLYAIGIGTLLIFLSFPLKNLAHGIK